MGTKPVIPGAMPFDLLEVFGHNDEWYTWRKKGQACKPQNTIPNVKYGAAASCCWAALLQEGLVYKVDGLMRQ